VWSWLCGLGRWRTRECRHLELAKRRLKGDGGEFELVYSGFERVWVCKGEITFLYVLF